MLRPSLLSLVLGMTVLGTALAADPLLPTPDLGQPGPVLRVPEFRGTTIGQASPPTLIAPRGQSPTPAPAVPASPGPVLTPVPADPSPRGTPTLVPQPLPPGQGTTVYAPPNYAPSAVGFGPTVGGDLSAEPWMAQPIPYVTAVPLYSNVKYIQERNIHPNAVEMIVTVKDPCSTKRGAIPACFYVKICVPPCDAPCRVVCRRDGSTMRYDWGKYAVNVTARKNGVVYVDYDD